MAREPSKPWKTVKTLDDIVRKVEDDFQNNPEWKTDYRKDIVDIKAQNPSYDDEMVKRDIQYREIDKLFKDILEQSGPLEGGELAEMEQKEMIYRALGIDPPQKFSDDKKKLKQDSDKLAYDMFNDTKCPGLGKKIEEVESKIAKGGKMNAEDMAFFRSESQKHGQQELLAAIRKNKDLGMIKGDTAKLISDIVIGKQL